MRLIWLAFLVGYLLLTLKWWYNCFDLVGWVMHGDLAVDLIILGLITFTKVKLHPPSSIMKSAIHQNYDTLEFYTRGGQIRRWHVVVRCWPTYILGILWWKIVRQHFILHVITLETWHNQILTLNLGSTDKQPMQNLLMMLSTYITLNDKRVPPSPPNNTTLGSRNLWFELLDQHLCQLRFQRFHILWSWFTIANMLSLQCSSPLGRWFHILELVVGFSWWCLYFHWTISLASIFTTS
jgi:hypothetical protein